MAVQYQCPHKVAFRCTRNGTRKPAKGKCPGCGGLVSESHGVYAALPWRQDGRYKVEQAERVFQVEAAAQRYVDLPESREKNLCVRFL
jgi:hypothetical protein